MVSILNGKSSIPLVIIIWALLVPPVSMSADLILSDETGPDISYVNYRVLSENGYVSVNMVLIKMVALEESRLIIEPSAANDSSIWPAASPSRIAAYANAYACINGPYFAESGGNSYPLGFTVLDGEISQLGNLNRAIVGIDSNGEFRIDVAHPRAFVVCDAYFDPAWLWGINSPSSEDHVSLYDSLYGNTIPAGDGVVVAVELFPEEPDDTSNMISIGVSEPDTWDGEIIEVVNSGSIDIPDNGYVIKFRGRAESYAENYQVGNHVSVYAYDLPSEWENMQWITTLGPWFIENGHGRDYSGETSYSGNITGRASRSCIGTTWNDEIFFCVITGGGLSISEAVDALLECNVRDAVMCDSGSSAGMWADGVGTIGGTKAVPLGIIVRDAVDGDYDASIKIWDRVIR